MPPISASPMKQDLRSTSILDDITTNDDSTSTDWLYHDYLYDTSTVDAESTATNYIGSSSQPKSTTASIIRA